MCKKKDQCVKQPVFKIYMFIPVYGLPITKWYIVYSLSVSPKDTMVLYHPLVLTEMHCFTTLIDHYHY